uniref:D-alanyl-D-alanine carboxypeptidase family protein n=1 Tax=Acetatifactor sp. TaxID=1872090 RepID=UPI0040575F93
MLRTKHHLSYKYRIRALSFLCAGILFAGNGVSVLAAPSKEELIAQHQALPIASNEITNWPEGPVVSAESAILIEINTGAILYEKNIHEAQYPASTTKILTALIASEQCSLDEVVTFSHDAVFGIPSDSNHIAMDVGDTLTMEQCLDAILIRSANEVSYAVAEHIGETWEGFADMMNQRASELGCLHSNFVNPNGLPDENHYTTAYDLAMIGRAFFANEMLCKITTTEKLVIPKGEETLIDWNQMKLLPRYEYAYEYLVGCKTGYTDVARSTLVSCAEKDGMKLICVVLNDEAPYQYEDTIALFNYGFSNFKKVNISQTETKYNIDNAGSFYSDNDIFGNSQPILSLNKDDYIVLPRTIDFADTVSTISYDTKNEQQAAVITYTYKDVYLGSASVDFATEKEESYRFDTIVDSNPEAIESEKKDGTSFIFINIVKVILWIVGIAAVILILLVSRAFLKNYEFSPRNNRRTWLRDRKKRSNYLQVRNNSPKTRRKAEIKAAKRRLKHRRNKKFWDV